MNHVDHVVIRRPEYVSGSREKPEIRIFTQTHQGRPPVPWGKISIGDTVWMKWSGGPVVAKSVVEGFRQINDCTPAMLKDCTAGSLLAHTERYFNALPPHFHAVVVYLGREEWLPEPFMPVARSRGESWIVLRTEDLKRVWLTEQAGALAHAERRGGRTPSRTLSYALRFHVLRRDDFTCTYCGSRPPEVRLHIDHIVPWSKGGENTVENLRTACDRCNLGKGAQAVHLAI